VFSVGSSGNRGIAANKINWQRGAEASLALRAEAAAISLGLFFGSQGVAVATNKWRKQVSKSKVKIAYHPPRSKHIRKPNMPRFGKGKKK
jgi:hypothetical protein